MIRLTFALLLAVGAQAHEFSFRGAPATEDLRSYLAKKRSPLETSAPVFIDEGRKWNVDPRLIASIAGAETTFGKRLCASNNAWNWFHRRTCPPSTFENADDGIRTVTKFMQRSYLRKGYTTIPLIQKKYCATGCENWTPLVTRFRSEMPSVAIPPEPKPQPKAPIPPTPQNRIGGIPIFMYLFGAAAVLAIYFTTRFSTIKKSGRRKR